MTLANKIKYNRPTTFVSIILFYTLGTKTNYVLEAWINEFEIYFLLFHVPSHLGVAPLHCPVSMQCLLEMPFNL